MLPIIIALLGFLIKAAPEIAAVNGVLNLILDLQKLGSDPPLEYLEKLFHKHGIDPIKFAPFVAHLKNVNGSWVSADWVNDPSHKLNDDGTFQQKNPFGF